MRQQIFPLPTVGAPSASNSPSALSARAGKQIQRSIAGDFSIDFCMSQSNLSIKIFYIWVTDNFEKNLVRG